MKDSELSKMIGQRINAALALRGRKQIDLAKHLGMNEKTANTISYYCKGTRTPNIEQLTKIAKYLDVSTDYLLGLTDVSTNKTTLQAICKYTGLSQEAVEKVRDAICYQPDKENNSELDQFAVTFANTKLKRIKAQERAIVNIVLLSDAFWNIIDSLYKICVIQEEMQRLPPSKTLYNKAVKGNDSRAEAQINLINKYLKEIKLNRYDISLTIEEISKIFDTPDIAKKLKDLQKAVEYIKEINAIKEASDNGNNKQEDE